MLVRENELRLSAEWQARFAAAERRWDKDWLDEAELLQAAVVSELAPLLVAGGGLARGVHALRLRAQRRPDLALYIRHNRARDCPAAVGARCPNPQVLSTNGQATSLLLDAAAGPQLIVTGSIS